MKQIIPFYFGHMRNADAAHTIGRISPVALAITLARVVPAALALKAALNTFEELMRQQSAYAATRGMKPLERERDALYTDLSRVVERNLSNPDRATRDAADQLDIVLRRYGNPNRLPHDTQTQVIYELVTDLTSPAVLPHLNQLPSARVSTHQLSTINSDYDRLYNERMAEAEKHITGGTQQARETLDAACRDLLLIINSSAVYLADGSLDQPIDDINAILADAEHLIHRRAGQRHRDGGEGGAAPLVTEPGPAKPECPCGES